MDMSALLPKLEKAVPKAVLNIRPFGHGKEISLWVEMRAIASVAQFLCEQTSEKLDCLENLSVMEIEGALVLTYFLRSSQNNETCILRGSLVPKSADAETEAPSVSPTWPMAQAYEDQAAELFGVRFTGGPPLKRQMLPDGWLGYPLRKNYIFPAEVDGILHMRPVGRTEPDEFGVHS